MSIRIWENFKASRIAPELAKELKRQIYDAVRLCGEEQVISRLSTYVSIGYIYTFLRDCLLFEKSIYDSEVKSKWIREIIELSLPYESHDVFGRKIAPILLGYSVSQAHEKSFSRGCELGESDALKYRHSDEGRCSWLRDVLSGEYQIKLKEPVTLLFRDHKLDEHPMVDSDNYLESIVWKKKEHDHLSIGDEVAEFKYRYSTITITAKIEGEVEYINHKQISNIGLDETLLQYSSLEKGNLD